MTGITPQNLKDAPSLEHVLQEFRLFLGNALFCAHNVNFDYSFISQSLEKYHMGILLNRPLCTINLAKQAFHAPKYGLKTLSEYLGWENFQHHRAYNDTLLTQRIFDYSISRLNWQNDSVEDIIERCMPLPTKKQKRKMGEY